MKNTLTASMPMITGGCFIRRSTLVVFASPCDLIDGRLISSHTTAITATGIRTTEQDYELDVIVLADNVIDGLIAEGKVNCQPLLTGLVGLHGVANAFEALSDPEQHAKILIDPKSAAKKPVPLAA